MAHFPCPTQTPPYPRRNSEICVFACVTTNFTFLTGASHPEEMVTRAAELGLSAIAITDRNSLAGVVRAYAALKELQRETDGALQIRSRQKTDPSSRQSMDDPTPLTRPVGPRLPRLLVGCRLVLRDSPLHWIALPRDRAAYQRLTRLLTLGKRRAAKGDCHLHLQDLIDGGEGLILIALPQGPLRKAAAHLTRLARRFPGHVHLGAAPRYDGSDQAWLRACARLAHRCSTPMVAVGDVLMHRAARRQLADVLTCLREGITIDRIGTRALPNAERRLKGRATWPGFSATTPPRSPARRRSRRAAASALTSSATTTPTRSPRARNRRPGSTGWRGRGSSSATRMARRAGCTT